MPVSCTNNAAERLLRDVGSRRDRVRRRRPPPVNNLDTATKTMHMKIHANTNPPTHAPIPAPTAATWAPSSLPTTWRSPTRAPTPAPTPFPTLTPTVIALAQPHTWAIFRHPPRPNPGTQSATIKLADERHNIRSQQHAEWLTDGRPVVPSIPSALPSSQPSPVPSSVPSYAPTSVPGPQPSARPSPSHRRRHVSSSTAAYGPPDRCTVAAADYGANAAAIGDADKCPLTGYP